MSTTKKETEETKKVDFKHDSISLPKAHPSIWYT